MDIYDELKARPIAKDESIDAYISAMDEIADNRIPEEDLIPMIVRGLGSKSKYTPMLAGATSIEELLRLIPAFRRYSSLEINEQQVIARKSQPWQEKTCYNCHEKGHVSSFCRKPQMRKRFSCFGCGGTDHLIGSCPKRTVGAIGQHMDHTLDIVEPYSNVSVIFHLETGSIRMNINALFDSGSVVTLIERRALPRDHPVLRNKPAETPFRSVGQKDNPNIYSYGYIDFNIVVRGHKVNQICDML